MEKAVEFDSNSKVQLLELFDKGVDKEGYIIERSTGERVLTKENEEVKLAEFAGFKKGSEIFIKSDITSLVDFAKD